MAASKSPDSPAAMPDVQGSADVRHIPIQRVGIKSIKHPVQVQDRSAGVQSTVADFNMYVSLPAQFKGTHMSRFVEILHGHHRHERALSVESFHQVVLEVCERLEASDSRIEMRFPYFMQKAAPVSGLPSLMDYEVTFIGEARDGVLTHRTRVLVPATSLCPCSKKISDYGAHNQRALITVTVETSDFVWIEEIVELAERQASAELYGLLKRPDEKYVTERAYENPKFCEDLVRDVAAALNEDDRIDAYTVEVENLESIHNHSAYAMVEFDKRLA